MIVELFLGIYLMSSHQSLPEIMLPLPFDTMDACNDYVQKEMGSPHDENRPAMLHDIGLTFRCAVRA